MQRRITDVVGNMTRA